MKMINKLIEYYVKKEASFWFDIADNYTDDESTYKIYDLFKSQIIQLILYIPLIAIIYYIVIAQSELNNILIPILFIMNIIYFIWVFSTFSLLKHYISMSIRIGRYKEIKELAEKELNKHV